MATEHQWLVSKVTTAHLSSCSGAEIDILAGQRNLANALLIRIYRISITLTMVLEAIKYSRGKLDILDQLQLPHTEVYDEVKSAQDAWHAIKEMRTRGAPAIAIVAALGLAVELELIASKKELSSHADEVEFFIKEKLEYLITSRPTAVNLADAARKLQKVVQTAAEDQNASGTSVKDAYVKAAEQMLVDDVSDNKAIGEHGADWILKNAAGGKDQVSILTHCNTG
jgi:methylthioribose-1-phosphate isomerase